MGDIFLKLLNMSLAASFLILMVLILRKVLKKAPKWIICLLGGIVAFCLVVTFVDIAEPQIEGKPDTELTPLEEESGTDDSVSQCYDMGDLDGNGESEYVEIRHESSLPGHEGNIIFFFNGESIYEHDDVLRMSPGSAEYIDLDSDGEKEIFFTFWPHVNSMPLVEYVVLKQTEGGWKVLEIPKSEENLDNAFAISILYGDKKNTIVIGCEGSTQEIKYDLTAHYETIIEEYQESGMNPHVFMNIYDGIDLEGKPYAEGDSFGDVAAWGIWNIQSGVFENRNCLVATHGLQGPYGKEDMLGELDIYFDYDKHGKINILNMNFRGYEPIKNAQETTENISGEVLVYIEEFDETSFFVDVIEWIMIPGERATELGLTEEDGPSGFYILNEQIEAETIPFAKECICKPLDWMDNYARVEVSLKEMLEILEERENYFHIPYHIIVEHNEIVSIEEQYVP